MDAVGLTPADAATLAGDRLTGDFYEAAVAAGGDAKRVGNLVINVLATLANKAAKPVPQLGIRPERVGEVAQLIDGEQDGREQRAARCSSGWSTATSRPRRRRPRWGCSR